MKQTVLFVMSPAKGHLNASFGLARLFAQKEYLVVYALPFHLHSHVAEQGFECVPLEGLPFGLNAEDTLDYLGRSSGGQSQRVKYFDNLIDRFYDTIYKARKTAIERVLQQTKPNIVLLDSFQSTDFVLLYPFLRQNRVKFAFVQTMLSFHQQPQSLPLNCAVVPHKNTNFDWYWKKHFWKRSFKNAWASVIFLGKSSKRVIQAKAEEQQLDALYAPNFRQFARVGFANIPEFIVAPQALEFTQQKQPNQHYLGLMVDLNRKESEAHPVFLLLARLLPTQRIVYCSFGTLYADFGKKKDILHFFKILLKTATEFPETTFVVNLSESFVKILDTAPANVHFFEGVPQLTVLARSSLFITHGGLNSIQESIALGVPMLVLPVDKRWDQLGNAAKVVYHGLGLMGNMGRESPFSLRAKIEALLQNIDFKTSVLAFKIQAQSNQEKNIWQYLD